MKIDPKTLIEQALQLYDLDFETEYRFHSRRKWRADYCVVDKQLLIEFEGGAWVKSRHRTGKGYTNDCEKYNQAQLFGYTVLRYTVDNVSQIFDDLQFFPEQRGGNMTWYNFAKLYDKNITEEVLDNLIWSETAFPMGSLKMVVSQLLRAIRANRNKIKRCEICGMKSPYHKNNCIDKIVREVTKFERQDRK